jgi:hypothetical protein
MTLNEIKKAVDDGKQVHWANSGYVVIKSYGDYLITHHSGNCIGLTWKDGVTLNGKESQFFINEGN